MMGKLTMACVLLVSLAVISLTTAESLLSGLTIHSEDKPYDTKRFPASYALRLVPESSRTRTYWLLPNKVKDQGFVVDLGEAKQVTSLTLYNTHNAQYNDRGTQKFEINLSIDGKTFTNIGAGSLSDIRRGAVKPERFAFSGRGRFLQFLVKSYYGNGAGLQHIQVFGTPAPSACLTTTTIHKEDKPYDAKRFPAINALQLVPESSRTRTYWLLPNKVKNQGFTIDMGSDKTVESVTLYNTHNAQYNDRGTKDFEVNLWNGHSESYFNIGSGTLNDVRRKAINDNKQEFAFTGTSRYLQFIAKDYYGNGAGLQYIQICVTPSVPEKLTGLTIKSEDRAYDGRRFPARHALQLVPVETSRKRTYWLLPNKVVDQGFVVDLGDVKDVSSVKLYNTHNAQYNDRGTKEFELNISLDAATYTNIGKGTLKDVRGQQSITPEDFAVSGTGQYLQFIAKSYYRNGAGLQYIEITAA